MEANASFISMMSMSVERLRLYLERSLGIARVGPMPIIRGATPAIVAPTNFARMGWLSSWARERRIRRTAAAGIMLVMSCGLAVLEHTYLRL